MTKIELYTIGESKTLESNKSHCYKLSERPKRASQGKTAC
jgi:hypothetical protein